jgi:cell division protein FtsN
LAASRRKASRARGATRGGSGAPGWIWLLAGLLIGLGGAWFLFARGYIPQPAPETVESEATAPAESAAEEDEIAPARREPKKSQYDFFTVLPEMEVVVPEAELSERTREQARTETARDTAAAPAAAAPASGDQYLLQVGSFRAAGDAEQLKARLALLGITARVQTVTVNEATWHRVRVGPVSGARQAEEMRRRLSDNGIDSLVMKNP